MVDSCTTCTEEEKTTISKALKDIKAIVDVKLPDLNADKRRYYGSINEQNKLFVNSKEFYQSYKKNKW